MNNTNCWQGHCNTDGSWLTGISGGNASWNQSFANGLYISSGNLSIYNGLINNASYLSTFNITYAGLINNASYLSTFNSTYDAKVSGNSSWNETYANTKYLRNNTNIDLGAFNFTTTGKMSMGSFKMGASTTAGYVLTADSSGNGTWQSAGAGSQTPWGSDIDGAGYFLSTIGGIKDNAGTPTLSIDPNLRILYAPDGTTPLIGWDNLGLSGALSFSSGAVRFSTAIEDNLGYGADSIETNNRILYASDGTTPILDWSTVGNGALFNDGGTYNARVGSATEAGYFTDGTRIVTLSDGTNAINSYGDLLFTGTFGDSITYSGQQLSLQFLTVVSNGDADFASYTVGGVPGISDCYDSALGGQVCSTSGIVTSITDDPSDKSFKDNIKNLTLDLNKFNQLKPSTWDWNNNFTGKQGQSATGLIADDVQVVYPSLVKEGSHKEVIGYKNTTKIIYVNQTIKDEKNKTKIIQIPKNITSSEPIWNITNYKTVDYAGIIALQTKKIQELESRLTILEGKTT